MKGIKRENLSLKIRFRCSKAINDKENIGFGICKVRKENKMDRVMRRNTLPLTCLASK